MDVVNQFLAVGLAAVGTLTLGYIGAMAALVLDGYNDGRYRSLACRAILTALDGRSELEQERLSAVQRQELADFRRRLEVGTASYSPGLLHAAMLVKLSHGVVDLDVLSKLTTRSAELQERAIEAVASWIATEHMPLGEWHKRASRELSRHERTLRWRALREIGPGVLQRSIRHLERFTAVGGLIAVLVVMAAWVLLAPAGGRAEVTSPVLGGFVLLVTILSFFAGLCSQALTLARLSPVLAPGDRRVTGALLLVLFLLIVQVAAVQHGWYAWWVEASTSATTRWLSQDGVVRFALALVAVAAGCATTLLLRNCAREVVRGRSSLSHKLRRVRDASLWAPLLALIAYVAARGLLQPVPLTGGSSVGHGPAAPLDALALRAAVVGFVVSFCAACAVSAADYASRRDLRRAVRATGAEAPSSYPPALPLLAWLVGWPVVGEITEHVRPAFGLSLDRFAAEAGPVDQAALLALLIAALVSLPIALLLTVRQYRRRRAEDQRLAWVLGGTGAEEAGAAS